MDGINAGRKTIPFARFGLRGVASLPNRGEAGLQEDAGAQLGLSRLRCVAISVSVLARADA